jgi:hypothetical protein
MLEQTERCEDGEACVYRGPKPGMACALGALLTDAEAAAIGDHGCNGATAYGLREGSLLPARLLPLFELVRQLQGVHDGCNVRPLTPDYITRLRYIAADFTLSDAVLEAR